MKTRDEMLAELGREYAERSEKIIKEWEQEHPRKGFGEGDIMRKKELAEEMALRYRDILETYK